MTYTVTFTVTGLYDVTVDAATPEEAVELAASELPMVPGVGFAGDLQDPTIHAGMVTDDDSTLYDVDVDVY